MQLCPFYRVLRKAAPRQVISQSRQAAHGEAKASYCTHDASPVTLDTVQTGFGGPRLKCRGDVQRCELPDGIEPVDDGTY